MIQSTEGAISCCSNTSSLLRSLTAPTSAWARSAGLLSIPQHGFHEVHHIADGLSVFDGAGSIRERRACVKPPGSKFFTNFDNVDEHWDAG